MSNTLLLVDGHSLAYRAFWAFQRGHEGGLKTSDGIPTSISFGFLKNLLEVLAKNTYLGCVVAFDHALPTFRHEVDATYKAGRPETPQEFITDLNNLKEILHAMQIPLLEVPGYEADDLLGTLAIQGVHAGLRVQILTGDQDFFQLIDDQQQLTVLQPSSKQGSILEFGPDQVKEKLGVWPRQIVDYKALCGDSSDNIPGVRGVGPKSTVKLLEEYPDLKAIYANLDKIPGTLQKKLIEGKASAEHSYWMAQIRTDAPVAVTVAQCTWQGFVPEQVRPLLEKLEFTYLIKQVLKVSTVLNPASLVIAPKIPQASADDLWFDFAPTVQSTHRVLLIDTEALFLAFLARLKAHTGPVAWDTETTSLDPRRAVMVGLGCAWMSEEAYYIPVGHTEGTCLDWSWVRSQLKAEFNDPERPKIFQNAKYDRLVLRQQEIEVQGVVFDPMLASYVLNPDDEHKLESLARRYLGIEMTSYNQLVPKGKTIAEIEISKVAQYCSLDALCALRVSVILQEELAQHPQLAWVYQNLELPLEPVLADLEWRGIKINTGYLKELSNELHIDLLRLEQQIYAQVGTQFNINSPKQLSEILFEHLKLSIRKTRKTTLGYSTDAQVLEKLQGDHPVVDTILEYRTLSKLRSTYVDALPQLVHPQTGRIHTDFNQSVTTTGRLSSSNPNLQNIPIRTAFSRRIRQAFIPQSGSYLVAADYSQIEIRILAHMSEEPILIETFRKGEDVHTLTAQLLLEREEITPEERRLAKTINFGVMYGMGAQRFARQAGFSQKEAQRFLDSFYARYPKVFAYLRTTEQQAEQQSYVETLAGRRRYFKDLAQLPTNQRLGALRQATNAPIQGTAADIIKQAMITLHKTLQVYQTRMVLQVHDELVFEVPHEEWPIIEPVIRSVMEGAWKLKVPLVVDIHCGATWLEAK